VFGCDFEKYKIRFVILISIAEINSKYEFSSERNKERGEQKYISYEI
jgi:hypothetical protein